jgi:hypothetical protein
MDSLTAPSLVRSSSPDAIIGSTTEDALNASSIMAPEGLAQVTDPTEDTDDGFFLHFVRDVGQAAQTIAGGVESGINRLAGDTENQHSMGEDLVTIGGKVMQAAQEAKEAVVATLVGDPNDPSDGAIGVANTALDVATGLSGTATNPVVQQGLHLTNRLAGNPLPSSAIDTISHLLATLHGILQKADAWVDDYIEQGWVSQIAQHLTGRSGLLLKDIQDETRAAQAIDAPHVNIEAAIGMIQTHIESQSPEVARELYELASAVAQQPGVTVTNATKSTLEGKLKALAA